MVVSMSIDITRDDIQAIADSMFECFKDGVCSALNISHLLYDTINKEDLNYIMDEVIEAMG